MVKNPPASVGDIIDKGLILRLSRFPYSCLESSHEQRSLVGYSQEGGHD